MKICYIYDELEKYTKNYITLKALEKNNVKVIKIRSSHKNIVMRDLKKIKKFLVQKESYDLILVGMIGNFITPLISKLTKKPIIFDPLISLYNTVVEDRNIFSNQSILGKISFYLDKKSVLSTHKTILDTDAHINYWVNEFGLPHKKFKKIFLGADDDVFYPRKYSSQTDDFIVKFYGGYIPAQGVDTIIRAASLLQEHRDIKFHLLGTGGAHYRFCRNLSQGLQINNVTFLERIPYRELPQFIEDADVMLGLFGGTKKFNTAIPHKVYQALAMKKSIVTGESDGCKDLLTHRENVFFCKANDPQSLANALLELKDDENLRKKIAKNGYAAFRKYCTPKVIGREIKKIAEEITSF